MAASSVGGTPVTPYDSLTLEVEMSPGFPITLQFLPQQSSIKAPEDDWTGISNPIERRRVQNRLHQRAWRKRRSAQRAYQHMLPFSVPISDPSDKVVVQCPSGPSGPSGPSVTAGTNSSESPARSEKKVPVLIHNMDLWKLFNSAAGLTNLHITELGPIARVCYLTTNEIDYLMSQFQTWANNSRVLGIPTADILITLVKINIFRALIINGGTLGFSPDEGKDEDAISPFCKLPAPSTSSILALPSALRPTEMQFRVPHHPWIDGLPFPEMRQNLIRAEDTYDEMELCGNLVGLFSAGSGRTGMIIWGEPWDINGWEVTEQFLEYWAWTIRGCWEVFESTNRWRAKRGESPLCFDNV